MDQQAATLLATLKKPAAPSDAKINALNALKSDIKHYRVPESAQSTIFDCLKLAITQQASSTLVSSALSTLGHLLKRLNIQDGSGQSIKHLAPRLFTPLNDRLGDLRESVRMAASQALSDLYPFLTNDVEELVRDEAMSGSNVRAKEVALQWVVRMHNEEAMPFKSYVPAMVARLEDADGNVRETAKGALVELFKQAPDRAKTDLKKQLKAHSVRHAIETQILSQINTPPNVSASPRLIQGEADMTMSTRSVPATVAHSDISHQETSLPPSQEQAPLDPTYVHSQRELEEAYRSMLPAFEGKETEQNWMSRDKSILKLRRLLKGNAPNDYHSAFMAGLKSMSEGILKVSNSLRTTMSSNGCQLVQELARTLGPALDPHVEQFLQSFIKMSAATKHIAAENGRLTADAIFQNCSYHVRLVQHIWLAAQEKNPQLRQCVPEWLRTILKRQASYKTQFEHSGGLELAEKCLKKGLDDANPKVKEGMRGVYWIVAKSWPERAEAIMGKLDAKSRSALEKDPNNPNANLFASLSSSSTVRGSGVASRNTLRELMAEQRKAKAAGRMADRPSTAMATMSPSKARSEANLKTATRQPSSLAPSRKADRTASTTSTVSGTASESTTSNKRSALMSGPVRRPRRPEIQRPQTADPYASRKLLRPETPASNASPSNSPPKGTDQTSQSSVPSSTAARDRVRLAVSGIPSPNASPVKRSHLHDRASPESLRSSRPSSKHSNTTVGTASSQVSKGAFVPSHKRPGQTMSVDSGMPKFGADEDEDEELTMVLPVGRGGAHHSGVGSPSTYRSPLKAMFEEARDKLERSASPTNVQAEMSSLDDAVRSEFPRRESPTKAPGSLPVDVQIYEDPFMASTTEDSANEERTVLGELPVNGNTGGHGIAQVLSLHGDANSNGASPDAQPSRERAEMMKNNRLLTSGIQRIRTRTLDAHGLRRVQDLVKSSLDIWDEGRKYDELMAALLDYLRTMDKESRLPNVASSKTSGLKAQAIGLVRALLTIHRKFAMPWHAKVLASLIVFRRTVDPTSHLLADLEKTTEEIVKSAAPEACVNEILDILPSLSAESSAGSHGDQQSVAMGLVLLRQLLSSKRCLSSELKIRLTQTAAKYLDASDAVVRKADVELASELFELFGSSKQEFWHEFKGTDEGRLGLLTYYIARNTKKTEQ